jgi:hypothetical protein
LKHYIDKANANYSIDTIAGQMRALRSGVALVDSDESDTEGEAGDDDTSDTDTDTDEE